MGDYNWTSAFQNAGYFFGCFSSDVCGGSPKTAPKMYFLNFQKWRFILEPTCSGSCLFVCFLI